MRLFWHTGGLVRASCITVIGGDANSGNTENSVTPDKLAVFKVRVEGDLQWSLLIGGCMALFMLCRNDCC